MSLNRDEVVEKILTADTVEAVEEARRARDDWMHDHPHDLSLLEGCELLEETARSLGMPVNETRRVAV